MEPDVKKLREILSESLERNFVGRESELDALRSVVSSTTPIASVYGDGGMGKSQLLQRFAKELSDGDENVIVPVGLDQAQTAISFCETVVERLSLKKRSEIVKVLEQLKRIEVKLTQAARQDGGRGRAVGELAGEVVGSFVPIPGGGIAGSHIGGLIGSGVTQAIDPEWLARAKLSSEELQLLQSARSPLADCLAASLREHAERRHLVILLDVYEKSAPEMRHWIPKELVPSLDSKTTVIVGGRGDLFDEQSWGHWRSLLRSIRVPPFDEATHEEFWNSQGVTTPNTVSSYYDLTYGHPYLCGILADLIKRDSTIDLVSRLRDELLGRLLQELETVELRDEVIRCAVPQRFDYDMYTDVLSTGGRDNFGSIVELSFVQRNPDGSHSLHDLARTPILDQASGSTPDRLRELHSKLFELLDRRAGPEPSVGEVADQLYHLCRANNELAIEIADKAISAVANVTSRSVAAPIFKVLDEAASSMPNSNIRRLSRAELAFLSSEWETATTEFSNVADDPACTPPHRVWANLRLGTICINRQLNTEAFDHLRSLIDGHVYNDATEGLPPSDIFEAYQRGMEAAGLLSKFELADEWAAAALAHPELGQYWKARVLLGVASTARLRGEPTKSLEAVDQALEILRDSGSTDHAQSFALIQKARVTTHLGRYRAAEDILREAKRLQGQHPFLYDLANCDLFLGNIRRLQGRYSDALQLYDIALGIHQTIGGTREVGPVMGSIAITNAAIGNMDIAISTLQDSEDLKALGSYHRGVLISRKYKGDLLVVLGDDQSARAIFDSIRSEAYSLGMRYLHAWTEVALHSLGFGDHSASGSRFERHDSALYKDYDNLRGRSMVYNGLERIAQGSMPDEVHSDLEQGLVVLLSFNPYDARNLALELQVTLQRCSSEFREVALSSLHAAASSSSAQTAERSARVREEIHEELPNLAKVFEDVMSTD